MDFVRFPGWDYLCPTAASGSSRQVREGRNGLGFGSATKPLRPWRTWREGFLRKLAPTTRKPPPRPDVAHPSFRFRIFPGRLPGKFGCDIPEAQTGNPLESDATTAIFPNLKCRPNGTECQSSHQLHVRLR